MSRRTLAPLLLPSSPLTRYAAAARDGLSPGRRSLCALILCLVGMIALPADSSAQCDPVRGRVFIFSQETGIASLTLKDLGQVPGKPTIAGKGTLRLIENDTDIPVTVKARSRSIVQDTIAYRIKGIAEPWHARGTVRLRGCPSVIDRVNLAVRAAGRGRLRARDVAVASLAATPSVNTILLDATDIGGLLSDQTDSSHLAFRSDDPVVSRIAPGSVIVAGVTPLTPTGLLRSVVSVESQGAATVLNTVPSNLIDAFEQLDIEIGDGSTSQGLRSSFRPNVTINGEGTIHLSVQQSLTYDFVDQNGVTVTVGGEIGVDEGLAFGIHTHTVAFIGTALDSFHIELNGSVNARVMATASYSASLSETQTLAEVSLGVYEIGPIVLTPKFEFVAGVEANLEAGISAEATAQLGTTVGMIYEGDWIPEAIVSRSLDGSVTVTSNASAKGFLRPELELGLYDTIGAHIGLQPYVQLDADLTLDPWWRLYGGLDADLGVDVSIVGHEIAGYDKTIEIFHFEIRNANSPGGGGGTTTTIVTSDSTTTTSTTLRDGCQSLAFDPGCITASSRIKTLVGDCGSSCWIFAPRGLDVMPSCEVYYSPSGWQLGLLDELGEVQTFNTADPTVGVRIGPDGSIYYISVARDCCGDRGADGVFRDGVRIAGYAQLDCAGGFAGDGGPATAASVCPTDIAIDDAGVLFISGQNRIRRVGSDGIITTYAGTGDPTGPLGDGGPATQASFGSGAIDVGPDGSVYIADTSNSRIRRIDPAGIITTVAGPGPACCPSRCGDPCGDSGLATDASFGVHGPGTLRVGPDNSIYVATRIYSTGGSYVRRVLSNGLIERVAGSGQATIDGEGGLALDAGMSITRIALGPDGSLYTAECTGYYCSNGVIRRIDCGD